MSSCSYLLSEYINFMLASSDSKLPKRIYNWKSALVCHLRHPLALFSPNNASHIVIPNYRILMSIININYVRSNKLFECHGPGHYTLYYKWEIIMLTNKATLSPLSRRSFSKHAISKRKELKKSKNALLQKNSRKTSHMPRLVLTVVQICRRDTHTGVAIC